MPPSYTPTKAQQEFRDRLWHASEDFVPGITTRSNAIARLGPPKSFRYVPEFIGNEILRVEHFSYGESYLSGISAHLQLQFTNGMLKRSEFSSGERQY